MGIDRPLRMEFDAERRVISFDTSGDLLFNEPLQPRMLDEFITLAGAGDLTIWEFAKRFGVLNIVALLNPGVYEEHLSVWRRCSTMVGVTLRLAASVHQNHPTRPEDWEFVEPATAQRWIDSFEKRDDLTPAQRRVYVERNCLNDILNEWIAFARVRPCFSMYERLPGITFTSAVGHILAC
jgi:hypothetical protein